MQSKSIDVLKGELESALRALNALQELQKEEQNWEQEISSLKDTNGFLEHSLKQEKLKNETILQRLHDLEKRVSSLQCQALAADKVKEDLLKVNEQNKALQMELEKVSQEYSACLDNLTEGNRHPSVKEETLRKTVKALENENQLLLNQRQSLEDHLDELNERMSTLEKRLSETESFRESLKCELDAKNQERILLLERLDRLEQEKINVLRQMRSMQEELDICQGDIAKLTAEKSVWSEERVNTNDILNALREGKKSVEKKLQAVLADNSHLSEQVQFSEVRSMSLEETVKSLQSEKRQSIMKINEMEQKIAEQTSLFESKISGMEEEIGLRLEEINENKNSELHAAKERYLKLFNEKAEEVHGARNELKRVSDELDSAKRTIADLEFREQELMSLLNKTRESMSTEYRSEREDIEDEIRSLREHSSKVEAEMESTRNQYLTLQDSYKTSVDLLTQRLLEISAVIKNYEDHEQRFASTVNNAVSKNSSHEDQSYEINESAKSCRVKQKAKRRHKKK